MSTLGRLEAAWRMNRAKAAVLKPLASLRFIASGSAQHNSVAAKAYSLFPVGRSLLFWSDCVLLQLILVAVWRSVKRFQNYIYSVTLPVCCGSWCSNLWSENENCWSCLKLISSLEIFFFFWCCFHVRRKIWHFALSSLMKIPSPCEVWNEQVEV